MDNESWAQGYFTGVALHAHLRAPRLFPAPLASVSATGAADNLEWFADLSGAEAITMFSAEYAGDVLASYSFDGRSYTTPAPLSELLAANPDALFQRLNPDAPSIRFRFRCVGGADLASFSIWGRGADGV